MGLSTFLIWQTTKQNSHLKVEDQFQTSEIPDYHKDSFRHFPTRHIQQTIITLYVSNQEQKMKFYDFFAAVWKKKKKPEIVVHGQ